MKCICEYFGSRHRYVHICASRTHSCCPTLPLIVLRVVISTSGEYIFILRGDRIFPPPRDISATDINRAAVNTWSSPTFAVPWYLAVLCVWRVTVRELFFVHVRVVAQLVRNDWQRPEPYSTTPCANICRNITEYRAQMFVHTRYLQRNATQTLRNSHNRVPVPFSGVRTDAAMLFYNRTSTRGRLIFRNKCTGRPMMNARFEPTVPIHFPSPVSNVADMTLVHTSFVCLCCTIQYFRFENSKLVVLHALVV